MKLRRFVADKPANTKVEIIHQADSFSVYIPPFGFHPFMLVPVVVLLSGVAAVKTALRVPTIVNTPFILFSVIYLLMGLLMLYPCLFCCFTKTYLQIDRRIVSYKQLLLGIPVGKQKFIPVSEIRHVSLIRRTRGNRKLPSELRLKGFEATISLSISGEIVDDSEIDWITYEVKEWLDLPLRYG